MQKQQKKQKLDKLQRKLQSRQFTLYEALQQDIAVDWFRSLHPAFLAMMNSKGFGEMISYVTEVGPPDNKIRSYKIPMISAEILSLMIPKVFQLFFMEDEENKGDIMLGRLLLYFEGQPNHVLSGYVIKIIMNLMNGNAPRVLQYLFKNGRIMKVTNFLESFSVVEFLFRIIIVEDVLLNNKIKERIELLHNIVTIYSQNKKSEQALDHINHFLVEVIFRLWNLKHKELGRFSTEIFRIVQLVIDNNNLYKQENLMIIIMRHLTNYAEDAPYLIIALFKKVHREISLINQNPQTVKTQFKQSIPKFTMKNLKLLQALGSMFANMPQIMIKQLKTNNIFNYLLEFIARYEWNSIVLVEIQKILKHAFGPIQTSAKTESFATNPTPAKVDEEKNKDSHYESMYQILFNQTNLAGRIKQLIKKQSQKAKGSSNGLIGRGYTGFLVNICKYIKQMVKENTLMGALILKNQKVLLDTIEAYLESKEQPFSSIEGFSVVHDVAKPHYNLSTIVNEYLAFFEQTETINKKYQVERPSSLHKEVKQDVLHEIENENQVVSKFMTESTEEKKNESLNQIVE